MSNQFRNLIININKRVTINNTFNIGQLPKFYSQKPTNTAFESLQSDNTSNNSKKEENVEALITSNKLKIKNLNWGERLNIEKPKKKEYKKPFDREKRENYKKLYPKSDTKGNKPAWLIHKEALKTKLAGDKWEPEKRLSRMAMDKIRFLHKELGDEFNVPKLSAEFKVSPESIRRILKSNYKPTQEVIERQESNRKSKRIEFVKQFQPVKEKKEEVESESVIPRQFGTYEEYKIYLNEMKKKNKH
ncbi:hypothetical protein CONCODRAFT_78811 [Conidiobolus coronatus NRRL 28638]|uniref:Required for respiratory growth protein 9, mitochondrial n=1 Tax=Conidiobolus coronatus (strain ATCC 28846 / CBS 209.66 / NRRL 28638) TaxID=796925 RepID=A0A137P6D8_CONC2|nr:hypothetical protein CONCODRAFT_78811 [Conidiobolus coronatus NRRL 28638]|eukprot:KXN70566.1 hypothetical protein CONCODRAFT_78811 [Conidiobolus coronatus NRRL 28638]